MKSYYTILGIHKTASETKIKKAYRKLALKWHPDKNKSVGAKDTFLKITEAYKVLSDPISRLRYDRSLSRPSQGTKPPQASQAYKKPNEQWADMMAKKAKNTAHREAQMKYRDFKKQNLNIDWHEQFISALAALTVISLVITLYYTSN